MLKQMVLQFNTSDTGNIQVGLFFWWLKSLFEHQTEGKNMTRFFPAGVTDSVVNFFPSFIYVKKQSVLKLLLA